MLLWLGLNGVQKLVFSFQLPMALLRCMTFQLAETTSWFLADGEIHLLCFFFHLLEVLFVQLAFVLDVAVFVAESAMLDVLGWPWLVGLVGHHEKCTFRPVRPDA